jgi:hypothetical protein
VIEFSGVGRLRSPVVVAAFEGWNDAADASSAAVEHLENAFGAKVVGAVDPDDYYDFQVNRPYGRRRGRGQPKNHMADDAVVGGPAAVVRDRLGAHPRP